MPVTDSPAIYFDGHTAGRREILVDAGADLHGLRIKSVEGKTIAVWRFENIRLAKDSGSRDKPVLFRIVDGAEERLVLQDVEILDVLRPVCPQLMRTDVDVGTYSRIAKWGVAAVAALGLMIFVIIPMLANTLAGFISPAREAAIGRGVINQIEWLLNERSDDDWTCTDPAGQAALNAMMARLMQDRKADYDLDVRVVDHSMVNAFAVPGGHMVFMHGLIDQAETPEEIAAVLAHELGHVVARDPIRMTLRAAGTAGLLSLAIGDATGGTIIAVAADQALTSSFSREAEAQADRFAHQMLIDASVPPSALSLMFDRLRDDHGDIEGIAEHFASHPALGDRIAAAVDATPKDFVSKPILSDQEWADLRGICDDN